MTGCAWYIAIQVVFTAQQLIGVATVLWNSRTSQLFCESSRTQHMFLPSSMEQSGTVLCGVVPEQPDSVLQSSLVWQARAALPSFNSLLLLPGTVQLWYRPLHCCSAGGHALLLLRLPTLPRRSIPSSQHVISTWSHRRWSLRGRGKESTGMGHQR